MNDQTSCLRIPNPGFQISDNNTEKIQTTNSASPRPPQKNKKPLIVSPDLLGSGKIEIF